MPDIASACRRYPIYVYFYAVAIYVHDPKMTMREAARNTRLCFGLEKFSPSTLCRVLKKLASKACDLAVVFSEDTDRQTCGDDDEDCAAAVLRGIELQVKEGSLRAPACDAQKENVLGAPAVPAREAIKAVLSTPFLKNFIEILKTKKPDHHEKAGFVEYIGRCCRKYFLLFQSLII